MKPALFLSIFLSSCSVFGQIPTWSEHVAPLVYDHCSRCHHEGSVGPFNLMSYDDVANDAEEILEHITDRHMPPWPADPEYRHFAHENVLSDEEIETITQWVDEGMPFGNPDLEPDPPVFPENGSQLDQIDFVVQIEPYTLQYDTDEYRWFVIETDFPETVYINQIEVISGLPEIVHHADISMDYTNESLGLDQQDPLSGFNANTGYPNYDYYMNAWQPGGNIAAYPTGWGIEVPPGADFVLEIHYGPGGQGLIDETKMNLSFVTDMENVRPVYAGWLLGNSEPTLIDGPLVIPANTTQAFHHEYEVPYDLSFVSICPHMHLLGESFRIWFENPQGDSIPLIDIPHWDFHWQFYYMFQQVLFIPAGSIIKSEGVYNNTAENEHNPNDPPETVYYGATTSDEMFMSFFIYTFYEDGDENIILDPLLIPEPVGNPAREPEFSIYPVPSSGRVCVNVSGFEETNRIIISDSFGKTMEVHLLAGVNTVKIIDVAHLSSGIYYITLITETGTLTRKFSKL